MARLSKLSRSIAGKVAVVTGAASGMGRATAFLLADEGARVAVVDVDGDGVAKTVDRIRNASCVATGFVADLADGASLGPLVMGFARSSGRSTSWSTTRVWPREDRSRATVTKANGGEPSR